jgi:hypothetical protein
MIVAKAYLDQLQRDNALSAEQMAALNAAIAKAEASHFKPKDVAQLQAMAAGIDKDAATAKTPANADRLHSLAGILKQSGAVMMSKAEM